MGGEYFSNILQCATLDFFIPGKVFAASDNEYLSSLSSYFSKQEQSVKPACIVIPTSTQDVSMAVTVLNTGFRASIPGCKFAVRGAGFVNASNV